MGVFRLTMKAFIHYANTYLLEMLESDNSAKSDRD